MVLVPKEIIRPATYWYTDQESGLPRKLVVSPEGINYFYDQGKAMRAAGLSIPVPFEHQAEAKPLTPAERAAKQLLNNAGWVQDFEIREVQEDDGTKVKALFGLVDVEDPEVAKKLPRTIRYSSPWINSFTDGNGKRWDGVISHLALTTRPRIVKQQPFPNIGAAMSLAASLPLTPFNARTSVPPQGFELTRAAALKETNGVWQPRYPMAFSLLTGVMLAEGDPAMKEKPKGPPMKGKPPGEKPEIKPDGSKDVTPKEKPSEGPPEPSAAPGAPPAVDEMGMPIERSLVDPDGDISVWDVICDLLASEGYDFPEGTTGENFPERAYKMLMAKLKEKGKMPDGATMNTGNTNQPPKLPGNDLPRNPVIEQPPALYMSLEEAQAIADPRQKQMAMALLSLQNNAIETAKTKRALRIEALCKRVKQPNFREKLLAQATNAQFSLGTDGIVKDAMDPTLEILEQGIRDLPTLLTTPQALLQEMAHPREEQSGMSEERRQEVVKEFANNVHLPTPA